MQRHPSIAHEPVLFFMLVTSLCLLSSPSPSLVATTSTVLSSFDPVPICLFHTACAVLPSSLSLLSLFCIFSKFGALLSTTTGILALPPPDLTPSRLLPPPPCQRTGPIFRPPSTSSWLSRPAFLSLEPPQHHRHLLLSLSLCLPPSRDRQGLLGQDPPVPTSHGNPPGGAQFAIQGRPHCRLGICGLGSAHSRSCKLETPDSLDPCRATCPFYLLLK